MLNDPVNNQSATKPSTIIPPPTMSPSKISPEAKSRTPIRLTNPTIPLGSLILVTGANGLNAAHTTNQLLEAGYRVRGTVRSIKKSGFLTDFFAAKTKSPNDFSLIEIPDYTVPGAWDDAVRGVAGIVHVVGATDVYPVDVDKSAAEELKWQIGLLEAARRAGTVKSFVLTSSAWAAWTPNASRKVTLGPESWNDEAVALARDKTIDSSKKGLSGFMALKTLVERGVWEWVNREKPAFAFNTMLLDTVIGEVLDPVHQGMPSTAGMTHWIWENKNQEVLNGMQPQWHVDTRDAGKLFVAALASSPQVDRERIYAYGARCSWFRVAEILREEYPDHKNMATLRDNGWDQTEVPNQRGEELLRRVGQEGWTSLEDSVRENAKSWFKLEGKSISDDRYAKLGV